MVFAQRPLYISCITVFICLLFCYSLYYIIISNSLLRKSLLIELVSENDRYIGVGCFENLKITTKTYWPITICRLYRSPQLWTAWTLYQNHQFYTIQVSGTLPSLSLLPVSVCVVDGTIYSPIQSRPV